MAKYTTDFLTWLKGLFYTETEVDNLLEQKINNTEVQGQVTKFTNKDRINIERLLNYMENGSGNNYYTLTLRGACAYSWSGTVNNAATTANLGVTNGDGNSNGGCCFVVDIRKNGVIQKNSSIPTVLKTVSGEKILDFVADSFSWASCYKYELANVLFGSTPGIHYVYAEATISGSVYKSNIIGVFVKDTNNKLDYNQWSAGEYLNSNQGVISGSGQNNITTKEFSVIGENSLRIIRTGNSSIWTDVRINNNLNQYTVSCKLYSPESNGALYAVTKYDDGTQSTSYSTFYMGNYVQFLSCAGNVESNKTVNEIALRIMLYQYDKPAFIDDLIIS